MEVSFTESLHARKSVSELRFKVVTRLGIRQAVENGCLEEYEEVDRELRTCLEVSSPAMHAANWKLSRFDVPHDSKQGRKFRGMNSRTLDREFGIILSKDPS